MEIRASYLLVGAVVLALVAGLAAFSVWLVKGDIDRQVDPYEIAFAGSVVLSFAVAATAPSGQAFKPFGYALLGLRAFKLVMAYLLFIEQRRSFQIYETFGGTGRNAGAIVAAGYMLRRIIFSATDNLVLHLILA